MDRDARIRARLEQHWKASEDGNADTEHAIYTADAILDYPQSGERFRGRSKIQAQRGGHPAQRHFTILRIRGGGDLWVSECVITYDGVPTYAVSVMEFTGDLVTHETQYFADPFQAPSSRAALAEPIPANEQAMLALPGALRRAGILGWAGPPAVHRDRPSARDLRDARKRGWHGGPPRIRSAVMSRVLNGPPDQRHVRMFPRTGRGSYPGSRGRMSRRAADDGAGG